MANHTYRPCIYDLSWDADRAAVSNLRDATPTLEIVDTLDSQLRELVKLRHPDRKLTPEQIVAKVEEHLSTQNADTYGVMVHYPWSNRLVHLLPEAEFIALRTNRNQYKITPEERDTLAEKKIGVIGLSVGQSVALTLAMERSFGEIRLADFDTLDLSNLNRIRSGVHNLGLPKVVVAAREIAEIDPFLCVTGFPDGITPDNLDRFLLEGGKLDLLIEEADGIDIKFLARYRARELRIPVVMDTSDRGLLDVERFDLEPTRPIFHGLVEDLDPSLLRGLTTEEKVPYILKILSPETMSRRMKASMIEIDQSITTWPQLASNVVLGGALTADVARRILLDQYHSSGRYFVDLEDLVRDPVTPEAPFVGSPKPLPLTDPDMQSRIERYLAEAPASDRSEIPPEQVEQLVDAGIQAPSAGNTQPWRWIWSDNALFLFHDAYHSASFLDYEHTASYTALGAAAENIELRALQLGFKMTQWSFPLEGDRTLVSVFTFNLAVPSDAQPHPFPQLADLIYERHTNRKLGVRQPVPSHILEAIRSATETVAGAKLHVLMTDNDLTEATTMLGSVERLRLLHRESHHDMMNELRWTPEEAERTGDGVDLETLDLSPVDYAGFIISKDWSVMALVEQWQRGQALAKLVGKAIKAASAVGLITMPQEIPLDYLMGGRAMQRAWLTATHYGIAFQPIAPISYLLARFRLSDGEGISDEMAATLIAIQEQYERLFPSVEDAAGVLMFRLAIADELPKRSFRRSLFDVYANWQHVPDVGIVSHP